MMGLVDAAMSALLIIIYLLHQVTLTLYVCKRHAKSKGRFSRLLRRTSMERLSESVQQLSAIGHRTQTGSRYSYLKLSTGLARAARMAWKITVRTAANSASSTEMAKGHQEKAMR